MAIPIKRFSAGVEFNQAVKSTLKTPISLETTFNGRIWANPILIATKTTMSILTRWFKTAENKNVGARFKRLKRGENTRISHHTSLNSLKYGFKIG